MVAIWDPAREFRKFGRSRRLSPALFLAALCWSTGCDFLGHSNDCGDHKDGSLYCQGTMVVQCVQGSTNHRYSCPSKMCVETSANSASCVLQGATCPSDTIGYQCLGNHRVTCLSNGLVTDEGDCSPQTQAQKASSGGPYCVENPGGWVLPCGVTKDKCNNEGQLSCLDDGSALCLDRVYKYFNPNNKGGEAICSVTPMANCWKGKTWCEGDVLKRCDRCLDPETCGSITVEATCNAGACVPYPRPAWMKVTSVRDTTLYGCIVDSTACAGRTGMVCVGGTAASCTDTGKAVVGLSCAEIQLFLGGGTSSGPTMFGPFCVERSATNDAICALDPTPCDMSGATRCAPSDETETLLDTCQEGVWLDRKSCENSYQATTRCLPASTGAVCSK